MSRPKSAARIQADIDKAIRKERKERKIAEAETKREARLKKRLTHESIVKNNGISPIHSGGEQLGLRDAIVYSPLVLCGGCGAIVRDNAIIGNLCPRCKYGKEVQSAQHEGRQTQGDALTGAAGPPEAQKGNKERRHS